MKLKSLLIAAFSATSLLCSAQISSTAQVQDVLCAGDSNGSILISSIEACFAPVTVSFDTLPAFVVDNLVNNGYEYINHGTGTGSDVALGVTSGNTSVGDVYITAGWFEDSISFDTITIYANSAATAGFVACFDAATSGVLWAQAITSGAGTYDLAYGAAMIGDKAYAVGYFEGTAMFGTTSITTSGGYQGFIAKYDIPSGVLETVEQVGNAGADECTNIRAGADDRLYVTGDFTNSITLAGNNLASNGDYDFFVTCYDSSLTQNYWAASGGGTGTDVLKDVVPSFDGNDVDYAYVTGYFNASATLGSNSVTSSGGKDFVVAKVDTNGVWQWAESGGSSAEEDAFAIDLNTDGDTIFVGGVFKNTMTYGTTSIVSNGDFDGFIAYIDTAGNLDDFFHMGGSGLDGVYDLACIEDHYLIFAAGFTGSLDFADSSFATNGGVDAFAGKIGPDMHEIWGKNFGSAGANGDVFNSIAAGPGTNMHCAGFIGGDASAYQSGLVAVGNSDAVVTNETFMGMVDTTLMLSNLASGTFYLSVVDSNGNSYIDTIVVGEPNPIVITGTVTNATTGTATDGAIDITVTGGVPGYTYLWTNNETTEDISGLSAGGYTVFVTDSNGCVDSMFFGVAVGASAFNVTAQITHLSCGGDSNGMIDLTVTGGTSPYAYSWSGGETTQDLTGLNGGTYTVTVTDNDTNTHIETFVVNEPTAISLTSTITPPSSGTASDGAIDITVSGGSAPYAYSWSNAATTEDISSLSIGNYTVTIVDSIGCELIQSFFVDTIPALGLVLNPTDVTCLNTNNGTVDLTVIGGVSPYTFAWSNGATTEDITGLVAGTYTVTVTDNASQVVSDQAVVGSNPIHPDPVVGPITGSASAQSWVPYAYSVPATNGSAFTWWATGGTLVSSASNSSSVQWSAGPDGVVYVSETDANGCYGQDSLVVDILFVGIDETKENAILVYPNPASDVLNIKVPASFEAPTLALWDMSGRLVRSQKMIGFTDQIQFSDLKAGVYTLTFEKDGNIISHKIIVQ